MKVSRVALPRHLDSEGHGAALEFHEGAWWLVAKNQGGYDCTMVDLAALLKWIRENRPDLLDALGMS